MGDYDKECVDLPMLHGKAVKMECIREYTNEEYIDAVALVNLSGAYRIVYEDGAEVEIGCLFAYLMSQGSVWFVSDSKSALDCVFVRDTRVIAYLANLGKNLTRPTVGECILPTEEEAERILAELEVPIEALNYGGKAAWDNAARWKDCWEKQGLIKWSEDDHAWLLTSALPAKG